MLKFVDSSTLSALQQFYTSSSKSWIRRQFYTFSTSAVLHFQFKIMDSSTVLHFQHFIIIIIIIIIMEFVDSSTLSALQQFYTVRVLLQMLLHSYLKLSSSKSWIRRQFYTFSTLSYGDKIIIIMDSTTVLHFQHFIIIIIIIIIMDSSTVLHFQHFILTPY